MTSWSLAVRFTNPYQFHFTLWNFNFTNYIYQFNFKHLSYKTPVHPMKPTTFAHLSHHSTFQKPSPSLWQNGHFLIHAKFPLVFAYHTSNSPFFFRRVLYKYILYNLWFHHFQPIWKICSSNWIISPGRNLKKIETINPYFFGWRKNPKRRTHRYILSVSKKRWIIIAATSRSEPVLSRHATAGYVKLVQVGVFLKRWWVLLFYSQIIHLKIGFPSFSPSTLGYPYFWKHPSIPLPWKTNKRVYILENWKSLGLRLLRFLLKKTCVFGC